MCVFVALGIQNAKRMRCNIFHMWRARLYTIFPHYLINGTIFEKQLLYIRLCFSFSTKFFFEIFIILRRIERDMIKMCIGLYVNYPLFL
jgi:hypothetical protein